MPPKKVIRALQSYRPQAPQELSFQKGDFFHVVSEVDSGPGWYEAHNPISGARGLVPKAYFEEFQKNNAAAKALSPTGTPVAGSRASTVNAAMPAPRFLSFYAIVQHDFTAERTDELDARAGDSITVVAQSNEEWFVAKPIGKLGRPGLIPASFVELRDPATNTPLADVDGIISRGELPKVEDWKRAMQEYKQSSISLGVIDRPSNTPPSATSQPSPYGNPQTLSAHSPSPDQYVQQRIPSPLPEDRPPTPVSMQDNNILPPGLVVSAEVVGYHFENDEYWFQINAVYQPDDPSIPPRHLVLFRVYDDFYDFQVALLDAFPVEAGRQPPSPKSEGGPSDIEPTRILPYMPGPVSQVDDIVSALRREELDEYLQQLCALREINAVHVLRHVLVRSFFTAKRGDSENDLPGDASQPLPQVDDDVYDQALDSVAAMSLGPNSSRISDNSQYDYSRSYGYAPERSASRNEPYTHGRTGSVASFTQSRNQSPHPGHSPFEASQQPTYRRTDSMPYSDSGQSISPRPGHSLNSPSISANNPQTAFVKIKIFHRRTDDLIAIRVNPRVTHDQLMQKVQERLGGDVQVISYRSSVSGSFVELPNDSAMRDWLDTAEKHVLYAS
ncbi:hypothetical protein M422DRAFT_57447 [Sphaerobolus stellatus SS14]|nr:hypothetical protein M422DRAFT_57447 [Sphaerobolus stellatus SS14]